MKFLRKIFKRGPEAEPGPVSDFFDVHHAKTLQALGLETVAPAAGEGPGFAVREFYLHHPDLQQRYPLGLLPVGQKRFVKWLLGKGRAQHDFSEAQILGFLHATAADLPRHIALTYLINPAWQQRFPELSDDGSELIASLRAEFPKFRRLRDVKTLPRIATRPVDALDGINFLSHFCYPSGLQQAALGYTESLKAAGLGVSYRDVPAGVRTELAPREDFLGLETFPITITNVSPVPHFERLYQLAGLARREGVLRIAYWAWELETVPPEWAELADSIDEIWTPTPFVAAAMRSAMPVPVYDLLPGVIVGQTAKVPRSRLGIDEGEFVFLFMFDMLSVFERKNPLAVVRAFRRAFAEGDRAALVIKVSRGVSDAANLQRLREEAQRSKVIVIDELVSRAEAFGFIAMSDCVVSLHRSEGFGLLLAEAMLLGKPVIATNYSGNTAFMNRENSLLVDYRMVEVEEDGPIYKRGNQWADPSVDHAAACMRRVFDHREEAAEIGQRGQDDAVKQLAPKAAGERMKARLVELCRGR